MRKIFIFALVATMFAACVTDGVQEPSATIKDLAPETLTVSFEGEESRIQLQEGKTVWNEGDLVSVFYPQMPTKSGSSRAKPVTAQVN